MKDLQRQRWLALALASGLGWRSVERLVGELLDPEPLFALGLPAFVRALGPRRGPSAHRALHAARPAAVLRQAAALGQAVLTPADEDWPSARLAALADPPFALFRRGTRLVGERPAAAIVGTRDAGPYGLRVARRLARALSANGLVVISGLALGIDGAAHEGALVEGGGGTIAVLGTGIDVPYPIEHVALKESIAASGGLLSEYPPGQRARRSSFPRRNRIVAALADVVVVVEAPHGSGALLTAQLALDMGREVLVVPGPVSGSSFRGSHRLLKRGAAGLCEGPGDVLEVLGLGEGAASSASVRPGPPSGRPLRLWGALDETEVVDLEELCRRTGLSPGEVAGGVAALELDGYVTRVPGLGIRRL